MKFYVINGPNLNFLGIREPIIYGKETYDDLCNYLLSYSQEKNYELELFQSNYEGKIIDILQDAYRNNIDGVIINPGAYTHYSYAIFDGIKSISNIPTVEVHLSNIKSREGFRSTSVTRDACVETFYGHGFDSYIMALDYLVERKKQES